MPLIASITDPIVNAAVDVVDAMGLPGVFLLMVAESACIPIPSEATMLFAGFNVSNGEYSLFAAVAVGSLANLVGSWIAYWVGYAGRVDILEKHGKKLHIKKSHLEWADRWFERHGDATVFFTRMLPIIRTFISLPAGVARMPFWRFSVFTLAGCVPWVLMLTFIGKQAGDNWEDWKDSLHYVDYAVAAIIVGGVVYLIVRARRRRGGGRPRYRDHLSERLPLREAVALGLIQGVTELVPVSSSAHLALVPRLLGWRYAELAPAERKAFEVALHAGTAPALALAAAGGGQRPRPALLALTVIPARPGRSRARAPDRAAAGRPAHGGAGPDRGRRGPVAGRRPRRRARRAGRGRPPGGGPGPGAGPGSGGLARGGGAHGGAVARARPARGRDAGAPGRAPRHRRRHRAEGIPPCARRPGRPTSRPWRPGAGASLAAGMAARGVFRRVAGRGSYGPLAAYRIAFGALALAASLRQR